MYYTAKDARDEYHGLIDRLIAIRNKVVANTGNGRTFSFPDWHHLSEGILLSAWTHWEQLNRELFIHDLATDPKSAIRKDVKSLGLRYKHSDARLAELIADHPDEERFVEWNNPDFVAARADVVLPGGHRFASIDPARKTTIFQIKRVRNAIAHNSDVAWKKFISLVQAAPYSLTSSQRKGITVGRFLTSHQTGGTSVLEYYLQVLRDAAHDLVP